jgi:hypothetical protein
MSPILNAEARRRHNREWIAKRRAEFFADKICTDCGATKQLELDRHDSAERVNHRIWSWSTARREVELANHEIRCASCRRKRLAARQTRHGTRGRYEKGCRCDACRAAKSRRNAEYRDQHREDIAAKQRARPRKPRTARTASGIVGVHYVPEASRARPWRAQIGAHRRLIHPRNVRHEGRSCGRPRGCRTPPARIWWTLNGRHDRNAT